MPIVDLSGPASGHTPRLDGPVGPVPLLALREGVRLRLRNGTTRDVRAVMAARWSGSALARAAHLHPVLIRRGALGPDLPRADVVVSANARFRDLAAFSFLASAAPNGLVAAKHLLGVPGVHIVEPFACRFVLPVMAEPGNIGLEGLSLHVSPLSRMSDAWSNSALIELRELFAISGTRPAFAALPT